MKADGSYRPPAAPAHLSERSKELWLEMLQPRPFSPGRLALFQVALECLDRADKARVILDSEGLVVVSERSKINHLHPLCRIEKESRALFSKIWTQLCLEWQPGFDARN